eukprot:403353679
MFTSTSGFFSSHNDRKLDLDPSVFGSLNMMAQRSTLKCLDLQRKSQQQSQSLSNFKRTRGSAQFISKTQQQSSKSLLPIHETKKYKSFPKLVSLMSNPFSKPGLNIGINQQKIRNSNNESMKSSLVNLGGPTSKHIKSRSTYYKTCKGCSVNINRLVMTRSIDRKSQDTIGPALSYNN